MRLTKLPYIVAAAAALTLAAPAAANADATNCRTLAESPAVAANLNGAAGRTLVAGARNLRVDQSVNSIAVRLGPKRSYVVRQVDADALRISFCLAATKGAAVRMIRVDPVGLSVHLGRDGRLGLRGGSRRSTRRGALRATSMRRVELTVNSRRGRATLRLANRVVATARIRPAQIKSFAIGSLAPTRRGRAKFTAIDVRATAPRPTRGSAPSPAPPPPSLAAPGTVQPVTIDVQQPAPASELDDRPFAPTSFWNAPLADNVPLDPMSGTYVNELVRQIDRFGPYMNTNKFGATVYHVDESTPRVRVKLDTWGPDLQDTWEAVPVPTHAVPAEGTDGHMTIWDHSSDRMWEFWKMNKQADGWHARWGGTMDEVSKNPGYFTHFGRSKNWGATGTGLPLLGGLVTEADLKRGSINHALAIAIVEAEPRVWSWPAQRTDGGVFTAGITPIPEGTRFRLNPNIDLSKMQLPKFTRMIAEAAQKYGIVVRDQAGAVVFVGQDPKSMPGPNPYADAFEGQFIGNLLRAFPWSQLQTIGAERSCCWSK
jgi:hypothetical protein